MSLGPGIRRLLALPTSRRSIEREVDDEVAFHIAMRVEALVASGLAESAARARALAEFGDVGAARRDLSQIDRQVAGRRRWRARLDAILQDIAYAVRGAARAPGFTLTVVTTLAVGIGVNAAMFSITDRLLLSPAPHIANAEYVRQMYYRVTIPPMGSFTSDSRAYVDYTDLAAQSHRFRATAAYHPANLSWGSGIEATRVKAQLTTASFFPLLGVRPHVGRFYAADEDAPAAAAPVVVLSYGFWQRAFGGDRSAIGQEVQVRGEPFTVIGVAPEGFRGVGIEPVDIFVPLSSLASKMTQPDWATTLDWQWVRILVQLEPDASESAAAAEATAIFRRTHARSEGERSATAILGSIIPGRAPTEEKDGPLALLLLAVSVLVLAIATSNVANLLVTRALRRRREIAVRVALGISRGRLLGQLVTESVVMALASAALALGVAWGGGALLRHWILPTFAPDDPVVDMRVFMLAAVVALGCGVIGGLAPAFTVNRRGFSDVLRAGMHEGAHRRSVLRSALVVTQATLTVVLVAGAGLFVTSLRNAVTQDFGYDIDKVLITSLNLDETIPPDAREARLGEARDRIAALPGVEHASVAAAVPFMLTFGTSLRIEGYDSLPRLKDAGPYINAVGEEYLSTMGIRLARGRSFLPSDVAGAPPVAIVNETMARFYFKTSESALGRCLFVGDSLPPCTRIVGVARDWHRESVQEVESAQYLVLDRQRVWKGPPDRVIVVRARGEPRDLAPRITRAVDAIGLTGPRFFTSTLQELVEPQLRPWRMGAALLVAFGLVALVVAAVGLYSVVAFDTAQRTQEVGVRVALGARPSVILRLVILDGLRSAGLGIAVGLAVTLAAGGLVGDLLFQVSPRDPTVLGLAVLVLLGTSIMACLPPARRATRIQPSQALRAE